MGEGSRVVKRRPGGVRGRLRQVSPVVSMSFTCSPRKRFSRSRGAEGLWGQSPGCRPPRAWCRLFPRATSCWSCTFKRLPSP